MCNEDAQKKKKIRFFTFFYLFTACVPKKLFLAKFSKGNPSKINNKINETK